MIKFLTISALTCTFLSLAWAPSMAQAQDDEFSFDFEEFSKSPWVLDGFFQGNLDYLSLNPDSPFYRLAYLDKKDQNHRYLGGGELQLGITYQQGPFIAFGLGKLEQVHDGFNWESNALLYEGNVAWQFNSNAFITAGKVLPRWGKGYAWNPTNFVGRLKNPADPDLSLEGHWVGQFDFVKSFGGALKNAAFTVIALPVSEDINADFGEKDHLNVASKLYMLYHNTDIELMALSSGSKSERFGLTLSRNLSANFEIHGEAALFKDFKKVAVGHDGTVTTTTKDVQSYLAGIRYLSSTNTTYIFEYYYNGQGYSQEEAADLFEHLQGLSDQQLVSVASNLAGYQVPNFMTNYLYLKASQKEPFGWLYITPSLFSIANMDDGSFNLIPEIVYTGVENFELRARVSLLYGGAGTEYGEKINDSKLELRGRYFF